MYSKQVFSKARLTKVNGKVRCNRTLTSELSKPIAGGGADEDCSIFIAAAARSAAQRMTIALLNKVEQSWEVFRLLASY